MSKILYVNETPAHLLRLRTEPAQRVQIMRIQKHEGANADIITLSKKEAIGISINILLSYENELLQLIEEIKQEYKNEIEEIKLKISKTKFYEKVIIEPTKENKL